MATSQPGYYPPGPPAYHPVPQPVRMPPKKQRWVWWLVGAVILFWGVVALGVLGILRVTAGPQNASRAYFSAVEGHDWTRAYENLDISLRTSVQPSDVEAMWLQREKANGPIDHFMVCCGGVAKHSGKADTGSASVILTYANGKSETIFAQLLKEDSVWKLSSLP